MDNEETTEEIVEESNSIRESLESKYTGEDVRSIADTAMEPTNYTEEEPVEVVEAPRAVAPPSDMNKAEQEAFLNPTRENSHVLQGYLSRRSLETRQEYEKRRVELEKLQNETQPFYETYNKHRDHYSKTGISAKDVFDRSIEWDMAMQSNPVDTALDWLDAYGLTVDDLLDRAPIPGEVSRQEPAPNANYLTREEAESIAEERISRMLEEQREKEVAVQTLGSVQQFMQSKPLFTATDAQTAAQLEERMAPIVSALSQQGGRSSQEVLETAYNYVVKGDPIFSDLERKLTGARDVKAQQAQTARAKKATKSISGSVGSAPPKIDVKDIRENLRRRLSEL